MNGYKNSEEQIEECKTEYKEMLINTAVVGSTIIFGSYEQDNDVTNGKEDIEWQVLEKNEFGLLVVSKYALDSQPYSTEYEDVTWENCSLRSWLNGAFVSEAFSSDEGNMINQAEVTADQNPQYSTNAGNNTKDKVFLLSIPEVEKYFGNDDERMCVPTEYTVANGVSTSENNKQHGKATCWWWLRSPGYISNRAADVRNDGSVCYDGYSVLGDADAVRPALWIHP